jgi:hypothetical protein
MTDKHTPEPWKVSGTEHIVVGGTYVVALDCKPADARRIVACVNACAGISNADLEMDNVAFINTFNERTEYKKRCFELTKQRDDLLSKMIEIQQVACSGSPELAIANEAIAAVKDNP